MRAVARLIFIYFSFLRLTAQSFHKVALVFDLNTGVEAFHSVQKYTAGLNGNEQRVKSEAGIKYASAGLEIGLNRRIGVGLRGKINSFFRDVDAVTRQRTHIQSTDLLLNLALHPVVRERFDLLLGAELGISDIDFIFESADPTTLNSRGHYVAPYLASRFYWGRLGFHLKVALPRVSYHHIVRSSEDRGAAVLSDWTGRGIGLSLGVQARLF